MNTCLALLIGFMFSVVAPFVVFANGTEVTDTLTVQSRESDGYDKTYNGIGNITSTYAYVGDGFVTGWRFEEVPIPPGAEVREAVLEIFCNCKGDSPVDVVYMGEAADNSLPFTASSWDLIYRPKTTASVSERPEPWLNMGWNQSPDLAAVVQEIVDRPGWHSRNALALFAVDMESSGKRSIYMMEKGEEYAARLTVTYVVSKIDFDTNGDGLTDISLLDSDGDGYFECPVGKTEYSGTLLIDKPLEIMGFPATRTETLFKGDVFILTGGGEIISDLTSPIVSSAYPELKGNDFQVVAKNLLSIEYGAQVLLGGTPEGEFAGDIYLETIRPGADLVVKEESALLGRHIDLISYGGAIHVRTGSLLSSCSHMHLRAMGWGDIHLNRDVTLSASSFEGDCRLSFTAEEGDLHMNRNVELYADLIDLCGIEGNIWDDGTVTTTGETVCW